GGLGRRLGTQEHGHGQQNQDRGDEEERSTCAPAHDDGSEEPSAMSVTPRGGTQSALREGRRVGELADASQRTELTEALVHDGEGEDFAGAGRRIRERIHRLEKSELTAAGVAIED